MAGQSSLLTSVLILAAAIALFAALEWMTARIAPPEGQDPRLGIPAFWLWAGSIAAYTYAAMPYFGRCDRRIETVVWGIGAIGWLAWKLGIAEGWEDTPREREQIWASTVGMGLACIANELAGRTLAY